MKNIKEYDISIEEFDKMDDEHIFSEQYQRRKKEMLREYKKNINKSARANYIKFAAIIALVLVSGPIVVNAATNGELFSCIWGSSGKKNVASHDEVVYDQDKDSSENVTYPQREYEDMDVKKAEELIGDNLSNSTIRKEIDGTTIIITSAVQDKNAAVVEFTLEKKGGVDALNYSQLDNEAKGAYFSDKATFAFNFKAAHENIFVDLEKTTDEKVYCYDYMTLDDASNDLIMELYEYPCSQKERMEAEGEKLKEIEEGTTVSSLTIPTQRNVKSIVVENEDGGTIEISPISMNIDMKNGLGLTSSEANDPWNIYYVSINYKDGTNYVVMEHGIEGKHTCEVEIDNSSYACGTMDSHMKYVFNRLVDTMQIHSIKVNDVEYKLK